ncbi:MAG: ABC transporter permease [Bacillota bacterium]|jgi:putative ABC transport system permease protein
MKPSLLAASFRVGVQTLRFNPLRTVLSTLGVVIGVASLVAVLAIGDGAEAFARDQIARTTDLQTLLVRPKTEETIDDVRIPRTTWPVFTLADADGLAAALGPRGTVSASVTGAARVTPAGGGAGRAAVVMGVTADAERRLNPQLAAGRFISEADVRSAAMVAVVSSALASAAGVGLGDRLELEGRGFRVVGILAAPATQRAASAMSAVVPFPVADSAMARAASPRARDLVVQVANVEGVSAAKAVVERWAAGRLGSGWSGQMSIATSSAMRLDQARKAILVFKMVMGAFAGISLVVGGLGIMNVLLAAVTERTREIGIRKATGARQRDILIQFLSESVAITGAGSVLGVLVGLTGAFGITALIRTWSDAPMYAALTWETVAVAAAVSIVVGLAFGTFPALRAARLSPIDAIRHE